MDILTIISVWLKIYINHHVLIQAEMRGQNGAAGEVIDLLAQKTGSHPLGALVVPGGVRELGPLGMDPKPGKSHEIPWLF